MLVSARLKKLQKLKNNFFCDEKNILCRAVFQSCDIFLYFVDRTTAVGGVVAVIKKWGCNLDLQKAHNVYYV